MQKFKIKLVDAPLVFKTKNYKNEFVLIFNAVAKKISARFAHRSLFLFDTYYYLHGRIQGRWRAYGAMALPRV